jgi:replication factor C subunit 3/5
MMFTMSCFPCILQGLKDFGYALCDIVTAVAALVAKYDLPDEVCAYITDKLSTIEFRLARGVNEKLQVGALVGTFTVARHMLA